MTLPDWFPAITTRGRIERDRRELRDAVLSEHLARKNAEHWRDRYLDLFTAEQDRRVALAAAGRKGALAGHAKRKAG